MYFLPLLNKRQMMIKIEIGNDIRFYAYLHHKYFVYRDPSDEEIKLAFERFYPGLSVSQIEEQRKRIKKLFKQENRHLFHVFSLDRDKNVAETIFKAIFKGIHLTKCNIVLIAFCIISYKRENENRSK